MDIKEIILRSTVPVVINSFNQPTYLGNIIKKFQDNHFRNIFILDNMSTDKCLLNKYSELSSAGMTVIFYNQNHGPRHFHMSGIYKMLGNIPHLYSDPDIDFDILSNRYLTELIEISEKYKVAKVGSALEIPSEDKIKKDLFVEFKNQESILRMPVTEWERKFWENEIESNIYSCGIDTTLHLFNPIYFDHENYFDAIRVAKQGFIVKHLPWYADDIMGPNEKMNYKNQDIAQWNNY